MVPKIKELVNEINNELFFFQNVSYQLSEEINIDKLERISDDLQNEITKEKYRFCTR